MPRIRVGEYLFRRITELGIKSVFGVPGDYELALLDLVPTCGLSWKGNANELVAAYAADGYARVNGVGALVTTFGPGELSALNAIGGAFAERIPIVHIVGYPAMHVIKNKMLVHHAPGEPNYTSFHEMSKHISCASTVIYDAVDAVKEIDRVLNAMIHHSQPCYIGIPGDVGQAFIDDPQNTEPLSAELIQAEVGNTDKVIETVTRKLTSARKPLVIVDAGTQRSNAIKETMQFIEKFNLPFVETSMSKGVLSETHPLFAGHYPGIGTSIETRKLVIDSDCILWFGPFINDLNTPTAAQDTKDKTLIKIHRTYLEVDRQSFPLLLKTVVTALTSQPKESLFQAVEHQKVPKAPFPEVTPPEGDVIKTDWFFSYITHLLQPGDVIVTETGTAGVNIRRTYIPEGCAHLTQKLWGSIGFATGAALGGFIAANEIGTSHYKRNMLFTGDGSFQMTAQAFGDYLRYETNGYIFVINNDGYTVERAIHGANASYNDIAPWNYSLLPQFFDSSNTHSAKAKVYQIRTPQELHDLIVEDKEFQIPDRLRVIEVFMGKHDYGEVLDVAGPRGDRFNLGLDPDGKANEVVDTVVNANGIESSGGGSNGSRNGALNDLKGSEHHVGG